jgi:pimeloyl-ACP methyl ester carboxylesterase
MSYQPLREARHDWLTVRGLKHHFTWWGPGSDDPLVLLHGFMDCGETWQFLVDCLPASWSIVAPDWRGFGSSDWAAGGYWFPDYLADLEEMLESLCPHTGARVVGHSMGANIAMLYAGIRPQRMRWLANLEGVGLDATSPQLAPARYAQWLDELKQPPRESSYPSLQALSTVLQQRNPRLSADRADFVACAWSRRRREAAAAPTAQQPVKLAFDPRHRWVNPVLYRVEEAQACWASIEIPVLLIAGEASEYLQRRFRNDAGERFLRQFRNLRHVSLPGVGHMLHHEEPEAVAQALSEFAQVLP